MPSLHKNEGTSVSSRSRCTGNCLLRPEAASNLSCPVLAYPQVQDDRARFQLDFLSPCRHLPFLRSLRAAIIASRTAVDPASSLGEWRGEGKGGAQGWGLGGGLFAAGTP